MSITNKLLLNPELLKDVQILVVDNDLDNRDLSAVLLESYGANVTTRGSIKEALACLNGYIPTILICEMRFLGESVYPLITGQIPSDQQEQNDPHPGYVNLSSNESGATVAGKG